MKVLTLLAAVVAIFAQEGNIIVHKQVDSDFEGVFASGTNFTVTVDVYNIGDGSAFDVSITDSWPESTSTGTDAFELADGSYAATWAEIPAGAKVTHNFTIVPKFEGRFEGSRATGQYQPSEGAEAKMVISTAMTPMSVLSAEQYAKHFAKHYQEWAIFFICASASVFIPAAVWGFMQTKYRGGIPPKKSD